MTYTKQEAIDFLVDLDSSDIQQMINQDDWTYLEAILRSGFIGYDKYTNKELQEEIEERSADDEPITVTA